MEKNIFENFIFHDNQSGGLSLVKFANEQQKGGAKEKYNNRFEDLIVPAGLVSCNQNKLRLFQEQDLNSKLIGGELFEKLFENISVGKKNNITKNNRDVSNKTKKIKK